MAAFYFRIGSLRPFQSINKHAYSRFSEQNSDHLKQIPEYLYLHKIFMLKNHKSSQRQLTHVYCQALHHKQQLFGAFSRLD